MKKTALLISVLYTFLISGLSASANNSKILNLKKISTEIRLDGFIESTWNRADSVSDFIQLQPFHGENPSYKTVAKVFSNETSLFCLMKCYIPKESIQHQKRVFNKKPGN